MKHIRLFETQAERDAVIIVGPMMVYTKETDKLEIEDVTPINIIDTPKLMIKMYEWGWAENPHYMTINECEAVTDAQFGSKKGSTSANSQFSGCNENFSAFKYFTSVTTLPSYMFRGCSFTKIEFPSSIASIANHALIGNWIKGTLDLSMTKITVLNSLYHDTYGRNNYITELILPKTCRQIGDGYLTAIDFTAARTTAIKTIVMPYTGTDLVGVARNTPLTGGTASQCKYYVPDELVNAYKADTSTSGDGRYYSWNKRASLIYPLSQWNGL